MNATKWLLAAGLVVGGVEVMKPGTLASIFGGTPTKPQTVPLPVVGGVPQTPGPTPNELANKLGVTLYRVRMAMKKTGKLPWQLTLADFQGIPEVPNQVGNQGTVYVDAQGRVYESPHAGATESHPIVGGKAPTFEAPTGSSGTWGGLSNVAIQNNFLAAAGGDQKKAEAMWSQAHAEEVQRNGF